MFTLWALILAISFRLDNLILSDNLITTLTFSRFSFWSNHFHKVVGIFFSRNIRHFGAWFEFQGLLGDLTNERHVNTFFKFRNRHLFLTLLKNKTDYMPSNQPFNIDVSNSSPKPSLLHNFIHFSEDVLITIHSVRFINLIFRSMVDSQRFHYLHTVLFTAMVARWSWPNSTWNDRNNQNYNYPHCVAHMMQ